MVITDETWVAASEIQRMQWRWDAAVAAYEAAGGFINLLGTVWTGRVLEAAS